MKWISVNNVMPEPFVPVLVYEKYEYDVQYGWFVDRGNKWSVFDDLHKVMLDVDADDITHWMPLPEIPREDEYE